MDEIQFTSDGTTLYAVGSGGGRPIVMLHGGLANHEAAWPFVAPLAGQYRVLAPDLRANGRSVYAGLLTWHALADDVEALRLHLGLERVVVGGASSGTGVALRYALEHPERTAGVVLVMPLYAGEQRGLTEAQRFTFELMDSFGRRAPAEGVGVMHGLFQHLPSPIRERAVAIIDTFDPASVAATTRFVASGAQPFASLAELRTIAAPTLVVPGNDALHPADVAALYAAELPHCRLRQAAGSDVAGLVRELCDGLAW